MSYNLPPGQSRKRTRPDDASAAQQQIPASVSQQRVAMSHPGPFTFPGLPPRPSFQAMRSQFPPAPPPMAHSTVGTHFSAPPNTNEKPYTAIVNNPTQKHDNIKNNITTGHSPRYISIQNQKYQGPHPIVVPLVPGPSLSTEQLVAMSSQRSARSNSIAQRIIAETTPTASQVTKKTSRNKNNMKYGKDDDMKKKNTPTLSIEELKALSSQRAQQSRDIAARIIAEDTITKQAGDTHDRYPCPAKKMGPAHNKNTAYFSIAPDSMHGMPLVCSHAGCRKGRLKFVFCKYCNQPVSRMKFDERHAHPEHLLLAFADAEDEESNDEKKTKEQDETKEKDDGKTSSKDATQQKSPDDTDYQKEASIEDPSIHTAHEVPVEAV